MAHDLERTGVSKAGQQAEDARKKEGEKEVVILSGVGASRSGAFTESKDPLPARGELDLEGRFHDAGVRGGNALICQCWDHVTWGPSTT